MQRGGRWGLAEARPLPGDGGEEELTEGVTAYALTRPGYAMALVVGASGEPGPAVLLRQPCAP